MPIPEGFKRRDEQLQDGLRAGKSTALADVVNAYGRHVRNRICRSCQHQAGPQDIEEAVNDVFQHFAMTYQLGRPVWPLLNRIAIRRGVDLLRKEARKLARSNGLGPPLGLDGSNEPSARPERSGLTNSEEVANAIANAASQLTEREAKAFWKQYRAERGYGWATELAQESGGTPGSWRKAAFDACEKMKPLLLAEPSIVAYLEKSA